MLYIFKLFKIFRFLFSSFSRILILIFLLISLSMNIIMFSWNAGAVALSGAFHAATGISSVVGKLNKTNLKLKQNLKIQKETNAITKKVSQRIANRTKAGVIRNVSATFLEAAPYIGVTAILGFTAMEIRDACNTMKDLDEISKSMGLEADNNTSKICLQKVPTKDELIKSVTKSTGSVWDKTKEKGSWVLEKLTVWK